MGWKDAPLLDPEALPPGMAWRGAPETDEEGNELVRPKGHGPIGQRYRTPGERLSSFGKKVGRGSVETVKGLPNAAVRAAVQGIGGTLLLPYDVETQASNFIRGGGFSGYESPWDFLNPFAPDWRPTTDAYMHELPGHTLNRLLDQYTTPPETGWDRAAEFVSSSLVGGKVLPKVRSATPTAPNPRGPSAIPQEIISEGVKHDVPVYADDVLNSPFAKRIGVTAESMGPFGTGAGRQAQHDLAKEAARRAAASRAVAGADDITVEVQKSMRRKLAALKQVKNQLYERAAAALDPIGHVGTPRFTQAFYAVRKDLDNLGPAANKEAKQLIKELYGEGPKGIPGNFSTMSAMSDELGSRISMYYKGQNATIGKRGVGYLVKLKQALDEDIAAFANEMGGPEGSRAYKQADEFYKKHLAPFKEPGFRDLVRTGEPEKAWRYLTGQGTIPSRSQRMFNALDERGRATVRAGLIGEAYKNALSPKGQFSPAKFATYMDEHEAAVQQFFKGAELKEIQGFKNLMRHIDRAGAYAENPPTGQRLLLPLLFGSGYYSVSLPALAVGSGLSVRVLFQTERGRDLLLQLSRAKPGSREAGALSNSVARYLTSAVNQAKQTGHPDREDINAMMEEAVTLGDYDSGR
jgi:hypothetical protein